MKTLVRKADNRKIEATLRTIGLLHADRAHKRRHQRRIYFSLSGVALTSKWISDYYFLINGNPDNFYYLFGRRIVSWDKTAGSAFEYFF
jgi:hypothetical protein